MREIKFRAFHKEQKRMFEVGAISFELKKVFQKDGLSWRFDEVELMQFTGLHDKNGKKIWENDIVKLSFPSGELAFIKWEQSECKFVAYRRWSSQYGATLHVCGNYLLRNDFYADFEIIGNIWDNPELIKETT